MIFDPSENTTFVPCSSYLDEFSTPCPGFRHARSKVRTNGRRSFNSHAHARLQAMRQSSFGYTCFG